MVVGLLGQADAQTNLVLVYLHTKTQDFPLAIENTHDKMVVAFIGKDLHARSLRNNNQTNADEKKSIQNLNIQIVSI